MTHPALVSADLPLPAASSPLLALNEGETALPLAQRRRAAYLGALLALLAFTVSVALGLLATGAIYATSPDEIAHPAGAEPLNPSTPPTGAEARR